MSDIYYRLQRHKFTISLHKQEEKCTLAVRLVAIYLSTNVQNIVHLSKHNMEIMLLVLDNSLIATFIRMKQDLHSAMSSVKYY